MLRAMASPMRIEIKTESATAIAMLA